MENKYRNRKIRTNKKKKINKSRSLNKCSKRKRINLK